MLYRSLRAAARVALSWYYAGVVVQGRDRIPSDGPLIIVSNHPNALVDALVVATTLRRRVLLTAKATLFEHPVLAALLRMIGVVPLRRAADERGAARNADPSVSRNVDAFRLVREALQGGSAVLVFPEGISHDAPALAPLKTGTARMAFDARSAGVRGVCLLPIGLIFERKEALRSRVLVRIGEPIDFDRWHDEHAPTDSAHLTATLQDGLRRVTLNFASDARALRAVALARALAAIVETPASLHRPRPLTSEVEIARRIETATDALVDASPELVAQTDRFTTRVETLERRLAAHHATLADIRVSPRLRHGAVFVVREGVLVMLAYPVAVVGRLTHWIPLRLARALAMRPLTSDPSRDQPAMRTIVLSLALVLTWYALQGIVLSHWFGPLLAFAWLAAIFLAAHVDFLFHDRLHRASDRARTYLMLRSDTVRRVEVLAEMESLLTDALALERALLAKGGGEQDTR